MGIDRDHWGMMLFPDYMESARTTKVMRQEAFVRAAIADEAAKASGAKSPTPGSVRRVDDAVQAVADALGCTFAVDTHNATKTAEGIRELVEAVVALRRNSEPEPQQKEPTTVSYERFTDRARKVMQFANQEARRFNHEYVGTEHVALGLVKEHAGVASFVLNKAGIDMGKVRLEVERLIKSGPEMALMGKLPYTPRTKRVLQFAIEESRALGHGYVGTEHILLGLLREPEGIGGQVIRGLGLSLEDARRAIKDVLGEQHDKDSAPAASEPELDEPAERAEGVPEKRITKDFGEYLAWQCERDPELKDAIDSAKADYEEIQAEIDRRVAELTEKLSQWQDVDDNWMVCPGCGSWCRDLPNDDGELSFCKSCKEVDELTAERDQARAEVEKFKTTDVGTLVADAIRADRESDERECRREIRRLRAEVERLKRRQIPDGWEISGTLGDNKRRIAELEAEIERLQGEECIANKKQKQRIAELESRVADQCGEIERLTKSLRVAEKKASFIDGLPFCPDHRDKVKGKPCRECEIERLSRPVDLGAVHKTRVDGIDYVYGYDAQQAVRRERNARESAEASLAELRELLCTHYLMWTAAGASTEWSFLKRIKSCPDADLDAALAAYRKTKEQAK